MTRGGWFTFLKSSEWDVEIATMNCLVHSSLNLPQAAPVFGMTKGRVALHLNSGGGGWTEPTLAALAT
jgi:hypothetical protein